MFLGYLRLFVKDFNVFLITVNTTRPDHNGMLGYIRSGVVFGGYFFKVIFSVLRVFLGYLRLLLNVFSVF